MSSWHKTNQNKDEINQNSYNTLKASCVNFKPFMNQSFLIQSCTMGLGFSSGQPVYGMVVAHTPVTLWYHVHPSWCIFWYTQSDELTWRYTTVITLCVFVDKSDYTNFLLSRWFLFLQLLRNPPFYFFVLWLQLNFCLSPLFLFSFPVYMCISHTLIWLKKSEIFSGLIII